MRISRGRRTAGASAVAVAVAGLLSACGSSGAGVVVSVAGARVLHYAPVGTGVVAAAQSHAVATERRSTVLSVAVSENEHVTRGQTLMTVFEQGETSAQARMKNLLREHEQQLPIVRAQDGEDSPQAQQLLDLVTAERAELTALEHDPTVLTAPADGWVYGLVAHAGQTIDRTTVALSVVDSAQVDVVASVLSEYHDDIRVGQGAQVSVSGQPGRTVTGVVTGVGAVAPSQPDGKQITAEQTVPVTVRLDNPGGTLTLGSQANVRLPLVSRSAVAVDSLAVLGQDAPFVFVVTGGVVHQQQVTTGPSDGTYTTIDGGLQAGQRVVISGGHALVDGDRVSVDGEQQP